MVVRIHDRGLDTEGCSRTRDLIRQAYYIVQNGIQVALGIEAFCLHRQGRHKECGIILYLTFRRLTSTIVDVSTANLQNCILYIYSTNIGTGYFKHGVYSPFFSL